MNVRQSQQEYLQQQPRAQSNSPLQVAHVQSASPIPLINHRKAANLYSPLMTSHELGNNTNGVSLPGLSIPNRNEEKLRYEGTAPGQVGGRHFGRHINSIAQLPSGAPALLEPALSYPYGGAAPP